MHIFLDGGNMGVVHTDMTEPLAPHLRKALTQAAAAIACQAHDGGVYVCTEGPCFETPAEIKCTVIWAVDLVGMTSSRKWPWPEKLECYATHCHGDKLCCRCQSDAPHS